jgi:hypothetical protein
MGNPASQRLEARKLKPSWGDVNGLNEALERPVEALSETYSVLANKEEIRHFSPR